MTKIAVAQYGSVPFDPSATTEKAVGLIFEAADNGARLVVFPEAFLGGYPKGLTFGSPIGRRTDSGRSEFSRYFDGAVEIDGPEMTAIVEASREAGCFVVMGIVERASNTLYCTAVMISADHGVVGQHRKLMPTGGERLIWGFGDGSTLPVVDSPAGRLGSVICWENYMPLLRQAMYAQDIEIYCAPTADDRDSWIHSMNHIALEGRCFVVSACQYITRDEFPEDYESTFDNEPGDVLMRGGSVIIDPMGRTLAGPLYGSSGMLYADIDREVKTQAHLDFDPTGHYSRPDIFELQVRTAARQSVVFSEDSSTHGDGHAQTDGASREAPLSN